MAKGKVYRSSYPENPPQWYWVDGLHDAYMSSLVAVCRNLGIEGIDEIMPDRKAKGDFACYIALFLSLEQR